jgi:hypothetical protein
MILRDARVTVGRPYVAAAWSTQGEDVRLHTKCEYFELKGGVVAPPYQSWQYAKSNGRAALRGRHIVNP